MLLHIPGNNTYADVGSAVKQKQEIIGFNVQMRLLGSLRSNVLVLFNYEDWGSEGAKSTLCNKIMLA